MIAYWKDSPLFLKHISIGILILISTSFVYLNSLNASFHLDDDHIRFRTNLHLSSLSFKSLTGTFYFTPERQQLYRPIPCLTLGLNYYFGKDNPFGYHLVNVSIHILCSLAVYCFLFKLLSIPGIKPDVSAVERYEIAAVASLLFSLHPIQTNVATYIIQRMTSIATFFYLLSFIGYIQFRASTLEDSIQTKSKTFFSLIICLLGMTFAFLSKENSYILPVMLTIADYLLFFPLLNSSGRKYTKKVYLIILILIICALSFEGPKYYFQIIEGYQSRNFTLSERLLTETRIIFFYLYLILIPNIRLFTLNHNFQISTNFVTPPQTLLSVTAIIILVVLIYRLRRKEKLVSFALAWYLVNLMIESTVIPLELIFEHRTYLPGVLIFCMISIGINYLGHHILNMKLARIVIVILLVLYGSTTVLRNRQFRSEFSLWWDAEKKSPDSTRALIYLGNAYMDLGVIEKAKEKYEKALELNPDMSEALLNLAKYYQKTNNTEKAIKLYKKALTKKPKPQLICIALTSLGDIYSSKKLYPKAIHLYEGALKTLSFYTPAIHNLGIVHIRLGENKTAEKILKTGIYIDSSFQDFYVSLAKLYASERRYSDAINVLKMYLAKNKESKKMLALLKYIQKRKMHNQMKNN